VVAAELAIFDVDDVVVRYDRDVRVDQLALQLGRPADEVTVAVFDSGLDDEADDLTQRPTSLRSVSASVRRESPSRSRLRC